MPAVPVPPERKRWGRSYANPFGDLPARCRGLGADAAPGRDIRSITDDQTARSLAEHFSIRPVARGDRSVVQALAYAAGAKLRDARTGVSFDFRRKEGVHAVELFGWTEGLGAFGDALEAAETRRNARTARTYVIALPWRLTDRQRLDLVRGYCGWLHEEYGVASAACLHAPPCRARRRTKTKGHGHGDPRDHHVHVIASTRSFDPATGWFGPKVRRLDHLRHGPLEMERQRAEWARRATEALREAGVDAVVDPRSHERRAAAGEAPPGLVPQRHAGPARTAVSRHEEDRTCLPEGATFERLEASQKN